MDSENVKREDVRRRSQDSFTSSRFHVSFLPAHHGFTLIELLVVIGIIVVLIAILLPVAVAVRKASYVTATQQEINRIAAACQAYYQDFRAYPGPVPETQVYPATSTPAQPYITYTPVGQTTPVTYPLSPVMVVTSSENLVLGLLGGLQVVVASGGSSAAFTYGPSLVGQGPQSLNTVTNSQKQTSSYLPEITTGSTELAPSDGMGGYQTFNTGTPGDSVIPEFYDHIPGPVIGATTNFDYGPILYVRARVAAPGIVVTSQSTATPQQYNFSQLNPYGFIDTAVNTTDFALPQANPPAGYPASSKYVDSATVYFANPAIWGQPKSKDSFLLISAGSDRIFGTKDDIIYSN